MSGVIVTIPGSELFQIGASIGSGFVFVVGALFFAGFWANVLFSGPLLFFLSCTLFSTIADDSRDELRFAHPPWMSSYIAETEDLVLQRPEEMMNVANTMARRNVDNRTGGPFGTIIVNVTTGQIVGWGVNRVTCYGSIFHGEIVAIWDAQRRLGVYNLGADGMDEFALVTTAQPCAMCGGAIPWSGVSRVIYGASASDVEQSCGFDEGPLHPEWIEEYSKRKIGVIGEVAQCECREVLERYAKSGGTIYNGGKA